MKPLLRLYPLVSRPVCWLRSALLRLGISQQKAAPVSVISVGNLTLGGSEKTPLAIELLSYLENLGVRAALVTRGYKSQWENPGGVLSDGRTLRGTWTQAGDEPLMIARRLPAAGVFVGKHRDRSCRKVKELGFDVAVLDDGFQHLKLARNLDIVLHDARSPSPFREGYSALARAGILLWKAGGREDILRRIRARFPGLAVFEYRVAAKNLRRLETGENAPLETLADRNVLAFCAIARPERFFDLLERHRIRPRGRLTFPDHYAYPERALGRIAGAAAEAKPDAVVTTEKDAVKVAGRLDRLGSIPRYYLEIGLELPAPFFEAVRSALPSLGKRRHNS